jgi:Protein of unknown function (DUF4231)
MPNLFVVSADASAENQQGVKRRQGARPFDPVWLRQDLESIVDSLKLSEPEKHFMRSRWLEPLLWMEAAAQRTRKRYYALRGVIALGAVIVPALVSLNVIGAAKTAILWVTFGVSLVVGMSAALEGFFRLGERWRHYRRRVEELKAEGWNYYELGGGYEDADDHRAAFSAFAAKVQMILAQEVEEFIAEIARAPEGGQTQTPGR